VILKPVYRGEINGLAIITRLHDICGEMMRELTNTEIETLDFSGQIPALRVTGRAQMASASVRSTQPSSRF